MSRKLLLIGGGGHCRSVLDSVLAAGGFDEIGIVDSVGDPCLGIPVVGTDDDIPALVRSGWTEAFVTVGSIGDTRIRRRLYDMIRGYGLKIPVIVDPSAILGKDTDIAEGVFVGKRAVINAGVAVDACAIVNTGAVVEHDCAIGAFAHISPGAVLCGQVQVGKDSHVGAGSVVKQQVRIGEGTLIGAGSVVVGDIPDHVKAYGVPCRVIRS